MIPPINPRNSHWGWPLLQFGLVIAIAVAVMGFMFQRIEQSLEMAERQVFDINLRALRAGLQVEVARQLLKSGKLGAMIDSNPVIHMQSPPDGYLGELPSAPEGVGLLWYFDQSRRELVFKPARNTELQTKDGRIRLRIQLQLKNGENTTDMAGSDLADRIRLIPQPSFRWGEQSYQ
jgi:hypothetical protein